MKVFPVIAKTLYGLEEVLAHELEAMGARNLVFLNRALRFEGNQELLYKANYLCHTALHILKPLATFRVFNDKQLYKKTQSLDWGEFLSTENTFAVSSVTNSDIFRNSRYIALRVKDAIADQFRSGTGKRPSVNLKDPDLIIDVHIDDKQCTLSLNSSGKSLDKRGYRQESTQAPVNEVLAAGMLQLAAWDHSGYVLDPMCGSGTIPIEAALLAYRIPPGRNRKFGFVNWPDFDETLWKNVQSEGLERMKQAGPLIRGGDNDKHAIPIARQNAVRAGVDQFVHFQQQDFLQSEPEQKEGLILMNPPYGERLAREDLLALYRGIGDRLKKHYSGYEAWILSSNTEALKNVGLRSTRKIKLFNGPLECRFQKYTLYKGTKKVHKIKP